jgi:hypothetical protein
MNHNQQSSDGMHEDEAALSDFLASLMDYTPTVSFSFPRKSAFFFFFFEIPRKTVFRCIWRINLMVFPCLYWISLSDTGRVGGALLSQERVPMSRRSTVGTFCSSFFILFYFFKIESVTCKERNCSLHRKEEIQKQKKKDHLHAIYLGHIGCFVVGKEKA